MAEDVGENTAESRTFANCMEFEKPWTRETRPGVFGSEVLADGPTADPNPRPAAAAYEAADDASGSGRPVPIFEFATNFDGILQTGGGRDLSCAGGGGSGLFNLNANPGIETDVSGCKLLGQAP